MRLRDHLRRWLKTGEKSRGPNDPEVVDEELLNVFRREREKEDGDEDLTTTEVASELSLGRKQTHNRLKALKKSGRLEKRRAGQTDMWRLSDGELETVINPEIGPIGSRSSQARRAAPRVRKVGYHLAGLGFLLLFVGMSIFLSNPGHPLVPVFWGFGYSSGLVGSFIILAGTVLDLAGVFTPRLVERFLL